MAKIEIDVAKLVNEAMDGAREKALERIYTRLVYEIIETELTGLDSINNVVYPSFNGKVNYYEGICFRIDSEYPPYVQGDINAITNATTYGLVVGRHAAILENIAPNGVMEFGCRTAELLKAGTKIEIWGVKS